MNRNRFWLVLVMLAAGFVLLTSLLNAPSGVAAPLAQPTPAGVARSGQPPRLEWFWGSPDGGVRLTADERVCFESAAFNMADIQWNIDQGDVNTITLKTQFSNDGIQYDDGLTTQTASAVDVSDLNQFELFAVYTCLYADLTNSNVITVAANGLFK